MEPAAPIVEARRVARSFASRGGGPPVEALREASLTVRPGEVVALEGPSGSGKTTLLHLLATIDLPSRGEVFFEGRDVRGLGRGARADLRLRRVGLVFADGNLSPALTVAENADLPLALRGLPAPERAERVAATLDRVGLRSLASRFPDSLSSGERQRAALARAIGGDPIVLLADEPTAHLDGAAADFLLERIVDLVTARGMAAVLATHDPRVIGRATRVARLRDGVLGEDR